MIYPKLLQDLINYYKKLPGIGDKSAERMALATLDISSNEIEKFSNVLIEAKNNLKQCKVCGHITEQEICSICENSSRNHNLICVIEDYKSVFSFEKVGNYQGVYHVLNGLISPMDHIGPEDINISPLIDRIKDEENDAEIILALKPSIEGETTTLYIKKIFENRNIKVSRLSYGIPMGVEIDYLDSITLDRALLDRKEIS